MLYVLFLARAHAQSGRKFQGSVKRVPKKISLLNKLSITTQVSVVVSSQYLGVFIRYSGRVCGSANRQRSRLVCSDSLEITSASVPRMEMDLLNTTAAGTLMLVDTLIIVQSFVKQTLLLCELTFVSDMLDVPQIAGELGGAARGIIDTQNVAESFH